MFHGFRGRFTETGGKKATPKPTIKEPAPWEASKCFPSTCNTVFPTATCRVLLHGILRAKAPKREGRGSQIPSCCVLGCSLDLIKILPTPGLRETKLLPNFSQFSSQTTRPCPTHPPNRSQGASRQHFIFLAQGRVAGA